MRTILFVALAALAAPVAAAPLDFNGWTAQTTWENAQDVTNCHVDYMDCDMSRQQVGGVPINRSMVNFDKQTHRIMGAAFWSDSFMVGPLVKVFTEKYGAPASDEHKQMVNKTGGPTQEHIIRWEFDNNASATIVRDENDTFVDFAWPENATPPPPPNVDF